MINNNTRIKKKFKKKIIYYILLNLLVKNNCKILNKFVMNQILEIKIFKTKNFPHFQKINLRKMSNSFKIFKEKILNLKEINSISKVNSIQMTKAKTNRNDFVDFSEICKYNCGDGI